jgi:eukaryotic-like serine/threonine-protein kinase
LIKSASQIGKVLDNYRIVELLGEGGMGVVYKAIHTKLDKVVALKIIIPGLAMNSKFIRRFQTEAIALAKLQNPNIVAIHDLRSHEGQWFIVMEYVDGIDLFDKVTKEGAFSWKDSILIVKQILSAIGHAHKAGIIHRDLKPHNIMLTNDGKIKITDFGLAKDEANNMQTMTVATGGTLNYMSPEHVKGFSFIEKRSDLYCIGIILYEMVTGEVPFKDLKSDFDIRESILRRDFDTPTSINAKIPKQLDAIIMKSIEKNVDDRFQSAEEMLEALENFEIGGKLKYKNKKRGNKSKLFSAKNLISFISIIAILLMVAGYFTGYFEPLFNSVSKNVAPPVLSTLSLDTNPENVSVFLNNDSISQTPLKAYSVQPGNYILKLSKDKFVPFDTTLVVEDGENINLALELKPIIKNEIEIPVEIKPVIQDTKKATLASIFLNSTPSGASVFVNSEKKGRTPLSLLELSSGTYDLRISNEGYQDFSKNIKLTAGQTERVNAKLVQFSGSLTINTRPGDVTLSIDNEIKKVNGSTTKINSVPIGNRKIKITKYGYSDFIKEVEIKNNQTTTINATLSQLTGKLTVKIRPWGTIYINDKLQKSSTDTKYETDLAVATYNIKVEHPTLGVWYKDIEIRANNNTEIIVNFTKKIPVSISAFGENGEPFAGNIFVDDKFTGTTTPQEIKLQVGLHNIKVEKEGYIAVKGQRRLLIEEDFKDAIIFILKEVGRAN